MDKAFDYGEKALKNAEKLEDIVLKAEILTNIGAVYYEQENYEAVLDYFKQAYVLNQKIPNNDFNIGRNLNNLTYISIKLDNLELAKEYSKKALKHNEKLNDHYTNAYALRSEGDIFLKENQITKAIEVWKTSLKISKKINNNFMVITNLNRISNAYLISKDYLQALKYLTEAQVFAEKYKFRSELRDIFLMSSKTYAAINDYKNAYLFHKKFFALQDSIFNEKNIKKINQLQTSFEAEKKEKEIIQLKSKQKEEQLLYKQKTTQQNWVIFSVLAALITSLIVAFLIFRSRKQVKNAFFQLEELNSELIQKNEEINQQKEEVLQTLEVVEAQGIEIHKQNESILDSIQYASRIQQAILPAESLFVEIFGKNQYFIYFNPRDIVSGDFYFLEHIELPNNASKTILALADCTGHGVPGAFMSMIGTQILKETVLKNRICQPAQILETLKREIQKTLKQSKNNNQDGMDITVLSFTKENNLLSIDFAAAMQSLYVVYSQDNSQEKIPIEYKGSRISIGGTHSREEVYFEQKEIFKGGINDYQELNLYLTSDGYQDQFGGKKNRKFEKKRLRELFESVAQKPFEQHKKIIQNTFEKWQELSNEKQIDDVSVLGIKVF